MKIDVYIDRLLLEGLPITSAQGAQVQAAVEKELARMLAAGGLSEHLRKGGATRAVRAGGVRFSKAQEPATLGQSIARAVHQGIGNSPKRGNPR